MNSLFEAILQGEFELARKLLQTNPEMALTKVFGLTPLLVVRPNGYDRDLVEMLLACGVEVNAKGLSQCTALHWAAWKGQTEVVELLRQHGGTA